MLDRVNHPCPVWRPRISAEFHGAQKSLQRYTGGHFSKGNRALIPPPVSAGSRGGPGGSRGPGIWELESRIWRPSWESNLGEQSGERELESRSWRAPWESNLGEQSGHAVWGLALGSFIHLWVSSSPYFLHFYLVVVNIHHASPDHTSL